MGIEHKTVVPNVTLRITYVHYYIIIFFFHGILRDEQPQLHMFSFLLTKLKRVNDPNQSKYGYVDYHSVLGNTLRIVSKIQRNIDPSYELNQQKNRTNSSLVVQYEI
jgi:hypothetical protein